MASRSIGGTVLASGIRTREKKERKLYSDDWALGDEEIEGHHTFDLEEKITTKKFDQDFVKDMTDSDFGLSYMQKNGFNWPLLFHGKKPPGIVVPGNEFCINDVRLCVGSKRMLDVMDVNTQKNVEMTMKDWQRYYESQDKDKLLNVISLEFSHTKLETSIEAPLVVRQIDWVEKVWPRHLKEAQTESTNVLEDMMYPKVQKYCLMSVSGCYTDFHIDFGGTSVWYHILKGKKIFWLIPASERNLQLYEQWVLSGKQSDIFFGDTVEKCARVELTSGDTFFIPTGWIHAVYTPEDSLVFGGNFLHSFGIEKQLRVAQVEDTTHVPQKFRYPFFTEMLWYVLERYVHVLLGKTHLSLPPEEQKKYEKAMEAKANEKKDHIHLTQYELHGLKAIVMYLHSLPTSKKYVPELIKEPIELIRDVRTIVEVHRYDNVDFAVTNKPVLEWWDREPVKFTIRRPISDSLLMKKRRQSSDDGRAFNRVPPNIAKVKHRRIRCKECEPCTRGDCRACTFCRDMIKYGGPGTMKQSCKLKKCIQPSLPAPITCYVCQLDGWDRALMSAPQKPPSGIPSSLMECCICFKIAHPRCSAEKYPSFEGVVNEDLTNSWECPECVSLGYNKEYKHNRVSSSRISSGGSDINAKSPIGLSETEEGLEKKVKLEPLTEENGADPKEDKTTLNGTIKSEKGENIDPSSLKCPTWEQLQARVSYPLVRPSWIIRPAPPHEEENVVVDDDDDGSGSDGGEEVKPPTAPTMMKAVMLNVFSKLPRNDILVVMRVCRDWAKWANDPSLWKCISMAHQRLFVDNLRGIVRRQPAILNLDWAHITYEQLSWLLPRLPQLDLLSCEGVDWSVLRALVSPYCPPLTKLNLSFCCGVDDETLSQLLKPPPFHRPGHRDTTTRLKQLTELKLAGTSVGDEGVVLIAKSLPFITVLDLSSCPRITEITPEILASEWSLVGHSLKRLDLRGCNGIAPLALPALARLPKLSFLALDPCNLIPLKAIKVWGLSNGYKFDDSNQMTRSPPSDPMEDDCASDSEGMTRNLSSGNIPKKIQESSKKGDAKKFPSKNIKITIKTGSQNHSEKIVTKSIVDGKNDELKNSSKSKEKIIKEEKTQHKGEKNKNAASDDEKSGMPKNLESESNSNQSEGTNSESCRRSERSNKGSKYKKTLDKNKRLSEEVPQKNGDSDTDETGGKKILLKNNASEVVLKRKNKKNVITRSKRLRITIPKCDISNPEMESAKRTKTAAPVVAKDPLKLRLTVPKEGKKYLGKLRKKSRDEQHSQTSSSPGRSRKEDKKKCKKRKSTEVASKTSKLSSHSEIKKDSGPSIKMKIRKERKVSSSSSSSRCPSPTPSVSSVLSSTKKLKVELEPIVKISRRRSDGQKPNLNSPNSGTGQSSQKNSSNRDRPERHHRSPRRLSMCQ